MEKLSDFILKLYPLDGVPLKKRVVLHSIFWGIMFLSFWFGIGLPSASFPYRLFTALYFTFLDIIFFYLVTYVILAGNYTRTFNLIRICVSLVCFYFLICLFSYIRVQLIIDNHWLSASNNRMYEYILQYYREGFSYFFRTSDIFPNLYEIAATSLPAFFIKFSRIFAKNSSEKKQLEIDFLRLQINPHFLVNTLNNIYSLVVTEDTRSPDAILSLSNLLDYVLYESSLPEISMDKEVKFLQDFIQLEKIRNSKKVEVFFDIEGDMQGSIAPLILIAFVENAFKHGVGDSTLKSSIRIKLKMKEKNLSVEVINSKPTHTSSKRKTTLGGIGLNNVKKRLSSIYATHYELSVKDERNLYSVFLSIKLK